MTKDCHLLLLPLSSHKAHRLCMGQHWQLIGQTNRPTTARCTLCLATPPSLTVLLVLLLLLLFMLLVLMSLFSLCLALDIPHLQGVALMHNSSFAAELDQHGASVPHFLLWTGQ